MKIAHRIYTETYQGTTFGGMTSLTDGFVGANAYVGHLVHWDSVHDITLAEPMHAMDRFPNLTSYPQDVPLIAFPVELQALPTYRYVNVEVNGDYAGWYGTNSTVHPTWVDLNFFSTLPVGVPEPSGVVTCLIGGLTILLGWLLRR
jgi:hypothetical protein